MLFLCFVFEIIAFWFNSAVEWKKKEKRELKTGTSFFWWVDYYTDQVAKLY